MAPKVVARSHLAKLLGIGGMGCDSVDPRGTSPS